MLSKKECTKSLFLSRISGPFLRVESDFFVICGLIKYSRGSRGKCGQQEATLYQDVLVLAGLVLGGYLACPYQTIYPDSITLGQLSVPMTLLGSFMVGFGSQLGNGCISGHALVGSSRLARRSLVWIPLCIMSAMASDWFFERIPMLMLNPESIMPRDVPQYYPET